MIKSTELRIGNILLFDDTLSQITAIDLALDGISNEIVADGNYNFIELSTNKVKGVPVNEETLSWVSFKKAGKLSDKISKWSIEKSKFIIYFNGEYAGLITSLPKTAPIYYIHQLQNVYYSLINEELPVSITLELRAVK